MSISLIIRQQIRQRANYLCEYCHSSEEASTSLFTLDHLMPQSLGGTDEENNRIAAEQVDPNLTESQKRELDRRIDDYKANPDNVMMWAEVKASIN